MKNILKNWVFCLIVCLVIVLFVVNSPSLAQEKADEELKKEYSAILAEYEFDWGGQTFILNFYVEGGALWADSGDGRPVTMKPKEEGTFAFTAEDPINGVFEFVFLKDGQGEFTICHLVNSGMGLDLKGTKIK